MNFYDDAAHLRPYSKDEILNLFYVAGLNNYEIVETGTVCGKYLEKIMLSYAWQYKDNEIMTYALWLHYMWSDYAVLQKLY